jgi:DNA/RNA-binding domain of Phe-tRNA-synthetase-like protein
LASDTGLGYGIGHKARVYLVLKRAGDVLLISASEAWRHAHPGAVIGLLELAGVNNTRSSPELEIQMREVEARLRERYQSYTRQDFLALAVMEAYARYYKRFEKTYHVLLQVESIALKGKSLPNVSPLVAANFAAEVETLVLTAGHDVEKLEGAIMIDVSRAGDWMIQMNGAEKHLREGDMVMRDEEGICCSIIYGQDNRSRISAETQKVLYVAYAPAGVGVLAVESQLQKIEGFIRLYSSLARLEQRQLLTA